MNQSTCGAPLFRSFLTAGYLIGILLVAVTAVAGTTELTVARDTISRFEGRVIDSIVIEPRNIYNTREPRYDRWIFRLANSLHIVTKKKVVRQEVLMRVGQPYSTTLAEEIGRNLRSSHALNDAWVEPEELPDGHLLVRVVTVDRWSLVGGFQFRREGNQNTYRIGFEERNLLGSHQFVVLDYFIDQVEGNYVNGRFTDRRLWTFPVSLDLNYSGNPLGSVTSTQLSHPYYRLSQHWTWTIAHEFSGGRFDFYHDTARAASTNLSGDFLMMTGGYRWGPEKRLFSISGDYRYRCNSYYDTKVFRPELLNSISLPDDSLYHRFGATMKFSSVWFTRAMRIQGMNYWEDVTLGINASVGFARAFGPHVREFVFDDVRLVVDYAAQVGGSLFFAAYDRSYVLREAGKIRQGDQFSLRFYQSSLSAMTLAVRSIYRSEAMADGSNVVLLGGTTGLRGYDKYFRTGDRSHLVNTEVRFYPQIEVISVIVGGALFADFGRAWKHGEKLRPFQDYYGAVGAGLRLSLEKTSRGELIRIDVSRGQHGEWQISADSHQFF